MSYLKLFRLKLNLVLVVFFSVFLLVISVKSSNAATCIPGDLIYRRLRSVENFCPNSGLGCYFEIWEEKHAGAVCAPGQINTTLSECRIRDSEDPWGWPAWYYPEPWGNTLRGPCFDVIGSAPCGPPNEVTVWWQWVKNLGTGAACEDLADCFFCEDYNGDQEITLGVPECGLRNSGCP
jgi:hypothetical protein